MKTKLSVEVRFAEPKDLDFCIASDFEQVTEDVLKREMGEKNVVLAEVDGKPVGYLRLEYFWLKEAYLSLITVEQEYRRKGVGTAMIQFLEKHLGGKGHDVLYSSSALNELGPQTWHRKVGFEECGIITGMNDGIGEVFFRKRLRKRS